MSSVCKSEQRDEIISKVKSFSPLFYCEPENQESVVCVWRVHKKLRDGEPSYTSVMVYTRAGSEEGRHYENRWDLLC